MNATITFTESEMRDVIAFCRQTKRNYKMLREGLKQNTFTINVSENPTVFWIPHQDGSTGVSMNQLRQFRLRRVPRTAVRVPRYAKSV